MKRFKYKYLKMITFVMVLALVFTACTPSSDEAKTTTTEKATLETTTEEITTETAKPVTTVAETTTSKTATTESGADETQAGYPVITISTKIGDQQLEDMKLMLQSDVVPNTVANFVTLANEGFYDGLIFHRIIKGFMIQGGDPTGTGMGGPEYSIYGEFSSNGFDNPISHQRGVISMARSQHPNSAGSQFFICHQDASFLDGDYAAFGYLISGESALDALATTKTLEGDRPESDCVITSITVDLNGYELPEVEKIQ